MSTDFDTSNLSWIGVLIYGFLPFGQLLFRIFDAQGSLDKMWLLLINIPPFSTILMLCIKLGWIKIENGQGGRPYDFFMIIPIVAGITLSIMLNKFDLSDFMTIIIEIATLLIATSISVIVREISDCNGFTLAAIKNIFINTFFSTCVGILIAIAIQFIPLIGNIFKIMYSIPFIGDIIKSIVTTILILAILIIINMFNGYNIKSYCDGESKTWSIIKIIATILVSIAAFFVMYLDGSVLSMRSGKGFLKKAKNIKKIFNKKNTSKIQKILKKSKNIRKIRK
jgi:hypothetical protein